ncbi:MAG: HDOD domain-containing protein [Gammaproteobacteria bacterium]
MKARPIHATPGPLEPQGPSRMDPTPSSGPAQVLDPRAEPAADMVQHPAPEGELGLRGWVERLNAQGMPVFAGTARDLSRIAASDGSSAAELARVVLQDAGMTARVLRVSNSPFYNQSGHRISTISRAVVVLGFDAVRSICLSIAVVEAMASGRGKERVTRGMARSFHAAVQARTFAIKRKDDAPEEVFIATLLYHLGSLAFWSFSEELADQLDAALRRPGQDPRAAERAVLGFELRDLTRELTHEWQLGELLEHAVDDKQDEDPRVRNVALGHELAAEAEAGWDAPEMDALLDRVAESLYLPLDQVTRLVHANADEAAKTAVYYGAGYADSLIPRPRSAKRPGAAQSAPGTGAGADTVAEAAPAPFPEPDPMLQLQILRELSGLLETNPDFNLLLEMVLEGVHRGIGLDRTLFALLTADRRTLKARYALGWGPEDVRERFTIDTTHRSPNIFVHTLEEGESLWVTQPPEPRLAPLLTPQVAALTGANGFFVMPIVVQNRTIGLFYADREPSGRPLDAESYTSFKHFCQQANLGLSYARGTRAGGRT